MASESLHTRSPPLVDEEKKSLPSSTAQNSFELIPPYILPQILSYIPLPHLRYRLIGKEWDNAMKIAHSSGQCQQCSAGSRSMQELRSQMEQLTWQNQMKDEETAVPWLINWLLILGNNPINPFDLSSYLDALQSDLIPFLDSLDPSLRCTIDLDIADDSPDRNPLLAEWCYTHSKSPQYTFIFFASDVEFETEEDFVSFFRSPSLKHVIGVDLGYNALYSDADGHRYPLTPFLNSELVSNLKVLSIHGIQFHSEDIGCLAQSPYLTNLTNLSFYALSASNEIRAQGGGLKLDAIICSPIMKNVKTFEIADFPELGYCLIESFARSKFLQNLTQLSLHGIYSASWSLESLLLCDATLPKLTSLQLQGWRSLIESDMHVITSPTSALFNQLESLAFPDCLIAMASIRVFCTRGGLRSLKRLIFMHARDEEVQLLASSPHFNNLQHLDFSNNARVSKKSVLSLYSSEHLPSLQHIDFKHCNELIHASSVFEQLREMPPRPNLRSLTFSIQMDDASRREIQAKMKLVAPQLTIKLL